VLKIKKNSGGARAEGARLDKNKNSRCADEKEKRKK
jgi:hypothetical protein